MTSKTQLRLYLSIFGDGFDINTLSRIAGLSPTDSWYKGEQRRIVRPETCWEYDFGGYQVSNDLGEFTEKFKALFSPNADAIAEFIQENDLESKLMIVAYMNKDDMPALYLDKETIRLLGRFNGWIDIDGYPYTLSFLSPHSSLINKPNQPT